MLAEAYEDPREKGNRQLNKPTVMILMISLHM